MTEAPGTALPENGRQREDIGPLIEEFTQIDGTYYRRTFERIGGSPRFVWIFHPWAALLGPVWYGARGLWNAAIPFLLVETFAFIQMARGLFGNLATDAYARVAQVEATLALRKKQLEAARAANADNVDVFERTVKSLEAAIGGIRREAAEIEQGAIWVALSGFAMLLLFKAAEGFWANRALEKRFSEWLSNRKIASGVTLRRMLLSIVFCLVIVAASILHYAFPGQFGILAGFPTDDIFHSESSDGVKIFFEAVTTGGSAFFGSISYGIRVILDFLEVVFVETPWIAVASFIILLTGLSAGLRAAVWSGAFLAYMGVLSFWDKAMTTLALLGTAACISIAIGIPLGVYCARRPRVYSAIRPIMDFMQTMPAFVFMIPVIAFFGTGKPAAVVTTMIFGGTPVVRLTVLGLRGVPESVREAAIAYGASKFYLLTKVDLPLAKPSIIAGINQTIMLSLAMVVVASLIGAKGLGEDVLEALQYASVGQGILAGFAILFCALILDRIVAGAKT